jgi:hypothetical protein
VNFLFNTRSEVVVIVPGYQRVFSIHVVLRLRLCMDALSFNCLDTDSRQCSLFILGHLSLEFTWNSTSPKKRLVSAMGKPSERIIFENSMSDIGEPTAGAAG